MLSVIQVSLLYFAAAPTWGLAVMKPATANPYIEAHICRCAGSLISLTLTGRLYAGPASHGTMYDLGFSFWHE